MSSAFVFNLGKDKTENIVVVIDPGHGGKDYGYQTDSFTEAQINLQLAMRLLELKKKYRKNIEFVFTRKADEFVGLEDRIALIDEHQADLFISIHCDSYSDENLTGFQIYHPSKGDQIVNSKKYAEILEKALLRKKTPMAHKSTKPADHFVITRAHCPAVLVNFGFLTNPSDLETVTNVDYQMTFAEAMAESINNYANQLDEK
jgi:N-acetylmuramoyl-L-alanine amidase